MKKILLATIYVAVAPLSFFAQEPSAFGARNLDSSSPYGLTSSEKVILKNKKELKKIAVKSNNQAYEVDSLRERIDGLQSVVESLSRKSQKNKSLLAQFEKDNIEKTKNSSEYELRLTQIIQKNSENIQKNLQVLEKMKSLLEKIDRNYISKKEFNALVKDVNRFKSLVSKELKNVGKKKSSSKASGLSSMSNAEVAKKAKAFYDKQYYTKGIEYYSHLILKNYKPAYAHFMIGQMNFHRKNYGEAISFYKKSASLYSKASYMPDLMLNTAISMEKTKDYKNAKAFYNGVIAKYPGTKQAFKAEVSLKYLE